MQFKTFDIIPHGTKFDFVGKRHIAVVLSLVVNLAVDRLVASRSSTASTSAWTSPAAPRWRCSSRKAVDPGDIRKAVEDLGFKDASVQTYGPERSTASSSAWSASR